MLSVYAGHRLQQNLHGEMSLVIEPRFFVCGMPGINKHIRLVDSSASILDKTRILRPHRDASSP